MNFSPNFTGLKMALDGSWILIGGLTSEAGYHGVKTTNPLHVSNYLLKVPTARRLSVVHSQRLHCELEQCRTNLGLSRHVSISSTDGSVIHWTGGEATIRLGITAQLAPLDSGDGIPYGKHPPASALALGLLPWARVQPEK